MKKILLMAATAMLSLPIAAQSIEVNGMQKISIPDMEAAYVSAVSPDGSFLLVTSLSLTGLQKYDLTTNEVQTISTAIGAGRDPKISSDGKKIAYRESVYKDRLRYNSVKSVDLSTGETATVVSDTRGPLAFEASNAKVAVINKGAATWQQFSSFDSDTDITSTATGATIRAAGATATSAISDETDATAEVVKPVVGISEWGLYVSTAEGTTEIFPSGRSKYLWISVSPDATKILYTVPEGEMIAYTCDIDGSNVTRIGHLHAPVWMGNDWVVGMVDADNGDVITESYIAAAPNAQNPTITRLTGDDGIYVDPQASEDASTIVCNGAHDGQIYLISVQTN